MVALSAACSFVRRVVVGMQGDEPHEIPVAKRERSDLLTQAHAVDAGLSAWCFDVIDGLPMEAFRGVDVRPVELLNSSQTGRDLKQGDTVQTVTVRPETHWKRGRTV